MTCPWLLYEFFYNLPTAFLQLILQVLAIGKFMVLVKYYENCDKKNFLSKLQLFESLDQWPITTSIEKSVEAL